MTGTLTMLLFLQLAASPAGGAELLGQFRDARSVSVAPDGSIFVVEFGRQRVVRIDPPGTLGISAALPVAVDASRGLTLLVADAASGSIDRVGRDGNLILRMAVPADADQAFVYDPGFQESDSQLGEASRGIPVDVLELPSGWVAAVEEHQGAVLLWDESGRPVRSVSTVESQPLEPSRIAVYGEGVLVLRSGSLRLVQLDQFGTFAGFAAALPDVVSALTSSENGAWVMAGETLFELDLDGTVGAGLVTGIENAVDLAVAGSDLLVLTATELHRVSLHRR